MLQKQILSQSWGIGLSAEQSAFLRKALGDAHEILLFSPGDLEGITADKASGQPYVLWVASSCGSALDRLHDSTIVLLASAPKVLLLEPGYSIEDFEKACDAGFTDILRPPLARERVADIMRRSLESHALHYDMECMSREILLERELLERKNDILNFLVDFLSKATESPDLRHLLQRAYASLEKFLPLRSMHAALWERDSGGSALLSLHICAPEQSACRELWREKLLEHARRSLGQAFAVAEVSSLEPCGRARQSPPAPPEEEKLLVLPLVCDKESLGLLILATATERHLGRDQALALDSAIRHLSLNVKNLKRFRQMQMFANYDALTKAHSRRHFETRLDEEIERFARYGGPLALIMLDIDRFKQVNDSYGHHSGDIVLREIAAILAQSVRSTDCCARYGGEEFAILLPHTEHKKAEILAERIRKRVASHLFQIEGNAALNITVSLGLASLAIDAPASKQALLRAADGALYEAKKRGRNCVCSAPQVQKSPAAREKMA